MAEKTKEKQPEKARKAEGTVMPEKPKLVQKARTSDKEKDRDNKPKAPSGLVRWWRETVGELRKVSWPSREDTTRLTMIVLAVMAAMGAVLGILDFVFSRLIALLVS